jgi:hypothetical protein
MKDIKGRKTKRRKEKPRQEFLVISWRGTTAEEFAERMKYFPRKEEPGSARALNLTRKIDDEK